MAPQGEKVVPHRGRSEDILPTIAGPFDFVYIDGLHMGFNALQTQVSRGIN